MAAPARRSLGRARNRVHAQRGSARRSFAWCVVLCCAPASPHSRPGVLAPAGRHLALADVEGRGPLLFPCPAGLGTASRLAWARHQLSTVARQVCACAARCAPSRDRVTAGPGDRGSGGVGTWRGSAHGTASASCPHMGGCDSAVSCRTATARLPPRAGRCRAMRARFSAGGCPAHDFRRDASRARQGWQHFAHEELRW